MRTIWKDEPFADEPLWRYFKVNRLVETLQSRTLHFPSARQFGGCRCRAAARLASGPGVQGFGFLR